MYFIVSSNQNLWVLHTLRPTFHLASDAEFINNIVRYRKTKVLLRSRPGNLGVWELFHQRNK